MTDEVVVPKLLTVVCFKWRSPAKYRSTFSSKAVNVLASMVKRNYRHPHEVVCVTDDAEGIDQNAVRVVPLWPDFANVANPTGPHNPSCYRRLKLFSPEAKDLIGERILNVDLDTVIVGDVSDLWSRKEDFVIWGSGWGGRGHNQAYNGSLYLLTAGSRTKAWDQFDPQTSPQKAFKAGMRGSDQGWLSYILPGEATWDNQKHGVYSFRIDLQHGLLPLPANAKMVMFHGREDPWDPLAQGIPWVRQHWR